MCSRYARPTSVRELRERFGLVACEVLEPEARPVVAPTPAVRSFAIVTTAADEVVRPAHDRMPVVLRREEEASWLDPRAPADALARLIAPRSAGLAAESVPPRAADPAEPGLFDALTTP